MNVHAVNVSHLHNTQNVSFANRVPVCFSIKKPKETDKLELCSALPVEESSNEEEEKEENNGYRTHSESLDKSNHSKASDKRSKNSSASVDKWAEERTKDKLVLAAKEKLVMKEREKQLQLERRKRALAFLHHIKKIKDSAGNKTSNHGNELRENAEGKQPSDPSSVTSLSSGDSTEDEDNMHTLYERSLKSAYEKAKASQTLQRILDAVPKDRHSHMKRSRHTSSSYDYFKPETSSKHRHHKSHKRSQNSRNQDTLPRSSYKHKHKSSRSHKRRRKNGNAYSSSSE